MLSSYPLLAAFPATCDPSSVPVGKVAKVVRRIQHSVALLKDDTTNGTSAVWISDSYERGNQQPTRCIQWRQQVG